MENENGSSNYRLTREVAEVRGRLEMVVKDQENENEVLKEIFNRLGILEKRNGSGRFDRNSAVNHDPCCLYCWYH